MIAIGRRAGQVEHVIKALIASWHIDGDRDDRITDSELWEALEDIQGIICAVVRAPSFLACLRGNWPDWKHEAVIAENLTGQKFILAVSRVFRVVVVAMTVEALLIWHLPRRRGDSKRVVVEGDRRRDNTLLG